MINRTEALSRTNPLDTESVLSLNLESDAGRIRLWCPMQNPKRYDILFRGDFSSAGWTTLASIVTAESFLFEDVAGATGAAGFYQLAVSDVNTDSDGLTDWEE